MYMIYGVWYHAETTNWGIKPGRVKTEGLEIFCFILPLQNVLKLNAVKISKCSCCVHTPYCAFQFLDQSFRSHRQTYIYVPCYIYCTPFLTSVRNSHLPKHSPWQCRREWRFLAPAVPEVLWAVDRYMSWHCSAVLGSTPRYLQTQIFKYWLTWMLMSQYSNEWR